MNKKGFLILLIATVVVVFATVVMRQSEAPTTLTTQGAYFPDLLDQSNNLTRAIIKNGESITTIERNGEQWQVVEKGNYPAATRKVRELVLGLARLQRVEAKTSNPELYDRLEVNDINVPGSKSRLVQLLDGAGNTQAILILGKEKSAAGGSGKQQIYVRSPGDAQTWLAEGVLPALDDVDGWVEKSLLGPPLGEVRSVVVNPDGDSFTVSRADAETRDFALQDLGADEQIETQYGVNQIAQSFSNLSFDEVVPRSDVDLAGAEMMQATLESFDDVRIELSVARLDEKLYGKLQAAFVGSDEPVESIQARVKQWNDLWSEWIYVLPDYQVDGIMVHRQDLLLQDAAEEEAIGAE